MMRMLARGAVALIVVGTAIPISIAAQDTALWYLGTYTRDILVWDEASEQVVDRIEMGHDIPASIVVNEAKDRIYVRDGTALYMELVDLKTNEVVDEFTLSRGNVTVRINGFAPHPSDEKADIYEEDKYNTHKTLLSKITKSEFSNDDFIKLSKNNIESTIIKSIESET